MSKGDSTKAQIIIRTYVMERFLERLSLSKHRSNLILKGGTLIAAMVGLNNRSTMDIDTTIKNLSLSEESARKIVEEVTAVQIDDGMAFEIKSVAQIMDEADYPGIRVMLETAIAKSKMEVDFTMTTNIIETIPWTNCREVFEKREEQARAEGEAELLNEKNGKIA
jgi:predicted nucleotidyltransferase component of viral defense system